MLERNALHKELLKLGTISSLENPSKRSYESFAPSSGRRKTEKEILCMIRSNSVWLAFNEESNWTNSKRDKILEREPAMLPILKKYWQKVSPPVSVAQYARDSTRETGNGADWGGAFISYLLRTSGLDPAHHKYPCSGRNIINIVAALRNFENRDVNSPFHLFDPDFIAMEWRDGGNPFVAGNILCFNRFKNGVQTTFHTYQSLKKEYWRNSKVPSGKSICEIIVPEHYAVENSGPLPLDVPLNRSSKIFTIGGNLGDSVRKKSYDIDANGNIRLPGSNLLIGMIRYPECALQSPNIF